MKRVRKYTYVERELIRQRAEKKCRIIEMAKNCLACFALVVCSEAFMFAMVLMS